jgi:branched-chain amino acid transport system ATP-binding protein
LAKAGRDASDAASTDVIERRLVVEQLRKQFGGVVAVDDASFEVRSGEIVGLVGPNGAGKSTVLSVISGDLKPTSGRVTFNGRDVTGMATHKLARTGLIRIPQLSREFRRLTVLENLLVAAPRQPGERFRAAFTRRRTWARREAEILDQATAILDRFDLRRHANDYGEHLSTGQKRLLEVMRALMTEPSLLLLDEPMAGINPTFTEVVEQCLTEIRDHGVTLVLTEHRLDTVDRLCDRVVFMAQGRVVTEGTMSELRTNETVVEAYLAG